MTHLHSLDSRPPSSSLMSSNTVTNILSSCIAELAIKRLALCFFKYNENDLREFWLHKKKSKEYRNVGMTKLVELLPLSEMRRFVRREYLDGSKQEANLWQWHRDYLQDAAKAVDVMGNHLVAGGHEGFEKFQVVWNNQINLVRGNYLSGEYMIPCMLACTQMKLHVA